MMALTLRHPWPWAIIRLGKRIENRTWRAAMAPGIWYAIHGGKMPRGDALYDVADEARDLCRRFRDVAGKDEDVKLGDTILTGIVALARHGGYITASDSPWFEGPVGWVISDLIVLPASIPCCGARGLWKIPAEIETQLRGIINEHP